MPVTVVGISGATWGLTPLAGLIAQMGESESTVEENPSKNANGEVAMTSFYNPTRSVEIGGVWLGGGASLGGAMAAFAFLLIGAPSGGIYCKSLRMSGSCESFVMMHLRGIQYNLI